MLITSAGRNAVMAGEGKSDRSLWETTPKEIFEEGVKYGALEASVARLAATIPSLPEPVRPPAIKELVRLFNEYAKRSAFYDRPMSEEVRSVAKPYADAAEHESMNDIPF